MLSPYAREMLVHELHQRKATADQEASYVAIIDKYDDGVLSTIPCPRCYADGRAIALIFCAGSRMHTASCDGCAATYDLRS
jgi:hypothetical protein